MSLDLYRELTDALILIRLVNAGAESPEEEGLVEEMVTVWETLSEDEQAVIRSEGPKTLIRSSESADLNVADMDALLGRVVAICGQCGAKGTLRGLPCNCKERFSNSLDLARGG